VADQTRDFKSVTIARVSETPSAAGNRNGAGTNVALGQNQIVADSSLRQDAVSRTVPFPAFVKLLLFLFLLTLPLVNPWVRGDGVGYYAYLRSTLIDHDLRFENDYLAGNESFVAARVDEQGRLVPGEYTRTGYVENHFSVGPAMLWAPAVVAVHEAVRLVDHFGWRVPADGRSHPYLLAMALSTATYGFLSLLLSFWMARKYFDERWAFLATLGLWLASSLPVYMYFNPSWSHALSAFGVALFLWYWDRTQLRRSMRQWALLGVLAGLMGNIYYMNVILLIFPGLEIVHLLRAAPRESRQEPFPRRKLLPCCVLFGAVFVVSLLPTFVTRQIIYGNPFETGYPGIRYWNWTSPALLQVLFSSDHGMFSWTPILLLATVGLFFLVKRNTLLGVGSLLTFAIYYYFIASYMDWDGLSSFGNRFFVSLTPIFVLGLAAFFSSFSRWAGKAPRAALLAGTLTAVLALWNVGFIFQWGTHMVPARGKISWPDMVHNQFVVAPLRLTHSLQTYFLHRKDMMRHIEQEDIEQQKVQGMRED
jgi:hypothetical protein